MITISLQQIRENSPCTDGWGKVLKSKGGKKADKDAQFPLTDVLDSNDLDDTLWCLRCLPEHSNLWRKFAVWAARQVESQMTDERSRTALDVAWRHSNSEATDTELADAWDSAGDAAWDAAGDAAWNAAGAARAAARDAAGDAAGAAARAARAAAGAAAWDAAWDAAGDAARDAARAAAGAAAGDAARDAAWDAAGDAARDAQKAKLLQILTAGEWVDDTKENGE